RAGSPEPESRARFVTCRAPFAQLSAPEIWQAIEAGEERIDSADFTMRVVPQAALADSPVASGSLLPQAPLPQTPLPAGWGGVYLRAPDILHTALERARGKLARLGDLGRVETGIYTGINSFFYVDGARAAAFAIEPAFLAP